MVENRFQHFIRTILENNCFAFDPLYCLRLGKKKYAVKRVGDIVQNNVNTFRAVYFCNFRNKKP